MDIEELKAENKKLNAALEKAGKPELDNDSRKRLNHLESENKELIASRDKAKQKNRDAEEAELIKNAEFKTLAETKQAQIVSMTADHAKLTEQIAGYTERDSARLKTLMESVPEAQRGLIKDSFSLPDRLDLAEAFAQTKTVPPQTRLPGEGGNANSITRQSFDALSPVEKGKHITGGGIVHD